MKVALTVILTEDNIFVLLQVYTQSSVQLTYLQQQLAR